MRIGIHKRKNSYSDRWIQYCTEKGIDFKIVNCYNNDIVEQLEDCDALLWHHIHVDYRDALFAKQLLFAMQQSGKIVFPDFSTGWHFDDKVGQKYLFEALKQKLAPAYIFYTAREALDWISQTSFPKVFKLRGGAASTHVRLVNNRREAKRCIHRAFTRGFSQFNGWGNFKDKLGLYRDGKETIRSVLVAFLRIIYPEEIGRRRGPEKSYVYFQEFIPNEGFDYRIEIAGDYCIACIRNVRKNDFRASGGHAGSFDKKYIKQDVLDFAFQICDAIKSQSCALDLVRHKDTGELYLIENSYCYGLWEDEFQHGYWDRHGNFYDEEFDSRDWIIESVIAAVQRKNTNQ
jgi:glutathione synthase/RimK-type ligase-like ATP-grasp enzyme